MKLQQKKMSLREKFSPTEGQPDNTLKGSKDFPPEERATIIAMAKTNKPAGRKAEKTVSAKPVRSAKPAERSEEKQALTDRRSLLDRQSLIIENAILKERVSALNAEIEKLRAA